jgi:hypothetical protein
MVLKINDLIAFWQHETLAGVKPGFILPSPCETEGFVQGQPLRSLSAAAVAG